MKDSSSQMITDVGERSGERGVALFIALILILILTFMGFGFLTRTMLVTQIAGAERWTTKAFFAADAGINVAKQRIRAGQSSPFTYQVEDFRGYSGTAQKGQITVSVSDFGMTGKPQPVEGGQTGGGQGASSEPLFKVAYSGRSTAVQTLTRSEAVVSSIQSLAPVPVQIQPTGN